MFSMGSRKYSISCARLFVFQVTFIYVLYDGFPQHPLEKQKHMVQAEEQEVDMLKRRAEEEKGKADLPHSTETNKQVRDKLHLRARAVILTYVSSPP